MTNNFIPCDGVLTVEELQPGSFIPCDYAEIKNHRVGDVLEECHREEGRKCITVIL